jgi:hypothetical protein
MRRKISLAVTIAAALTALTALPFTPAGLRSSVVSAHPGPHPAAVLPTYDYDTVAPGAQPPTAPELANPTGRILSNLGLAFTVYVPLAELQAILPPGFAATPAQPPVSPDLAGLGFQYTFHHQCAHATAGVSAPAAGLSVYHFARNTVLNRIESLALAVEQSDESFVDCQQALLGPNGSRVADVEAQATQKRDQLHLKFDVADKDIGLWIRVRAEGPSALVARGNHADPVVVSSRTLDGGVQPNPAQRWSVMSDQLFIPATAMNFRLEVGGRRKIPAGLLGLPGGAVTVVSVDPTFRFNRFENFYQPE